MRSLVFCCALCAFVAPVSAEVIVVEDGESFDRIDVLLGDELVMNGGHVEFLNNQGGSVTINGGTLGAAVAEEVRDTERHAAHVTITGYGQQLGRWISPGPIVNTHGIAHAEVHGYNFRVYVNPRSSQRLDVVGFGWLLDGSVVHFELQFDRVDDYRELQTMTLVTHEREFADPTGDWAFDLSDLNMVRNNFGSSSGPGDTNFDGVVDLVDLNTARNWFGVKYPDSVPPEWEYSGDVPLNSRFMWNPTMPAPVPEPSTMALLALSLLAGIPLRCRCCSWLRRSP